MAYPDITQSQDSRELRVTGRQLDRATNGTPRVRSFYPADKREFVVVHTYVSNAEKLALEAFIGANADNSFEFVWAGDGTSYTCLLSDTPPEYTPNGGTQWTVTVYLVQA